MNRNGFEVNDRVAATTEDGSELVFGTVLRLSNLRTTAHVKWDTGELTALSVKELSKAVAS